uniref:Glutaredoxin 5 n=1 Tax=Falco tinnunculus TaxID=100819 RepID=A0A8C4XSR1_FALTI
MSGVVRLGWRLGAAAARGRAGRPLSQAPAGGDEVGGAQGGGSGSGSREAVERLVRAHPVVVFMKGSPAQPLCGFSNAVVQILRLHGVEDYRAHDVLQDPELRQGSQVPKKVVLFPAMHQLWHLSDCMESQLSLLTGSLGIRVELACCTVR